MKNFIKKNFLKFLILNFASLLTITSLANEPHLTVANEVRTVKTGVLNDSFIEKYLLTSNSVDEFLSKIKKDPQTQPYLRRYIPIWNSSSLQRSFYFCPRILMYNKDVSFIFSITYCPVFSHERDDVEVVQWNEKEQTYETYSIHFKLDGQVVKPSLGTENPSECLRCHNGGIAIGVYDPFSFPNEDTSYWLENLDYFSQQIGKHGFHIKKNGFKINLYRYRDYLDIEGNSQLWRNSDPENNPLHIFNTALAQRNHIRTIKVMKEFINKTHKEKTKGEKPPNYDEIKYAILAGISDCPNYDELIVQKENGTTPLSQQKIAEFIRQYGMEGLLRSYYKSEKVAYDLHNHIRNRIGALRKLEDGINSVESSNSAMRKQYHFSQTRIVENFYYVFLYYTENFEYLQIPSREKNLFGMEEALLLANQNPIKISWHGAWSFANLVDVMLKTDKDFSNLLKITDDSMGVKISTYEYLRVKMGLSVEDKSLDFTLWKEVQEVLSNKENKKANEVSSQYQILLDTNRPEFLNYCEDIKVLYMEYIGYFDEETKRVEAGANPY